MKSKTKNEPWQPAQPYILQGLRNTQNVFDQQQPRLDSMGDTAYGLFNQLAPNAMGPNQFTMGGQGMLSDTMGGQYLQGNPYLDQMISKGSQGISDNVNSMFSGAGRYGSGAHQGVLGDAIGDYDMGMRFQNYDAERQRMLQAASLVPALRATEFAGVPETLNSLQSAAEIPWTGVNAYTGNIRQGSQGYGQTTTNSGLGGALGMGLYGASLFAGGK